MGRSDCGMLLSRGYGGEKEMEAVVDGTGGSRWRDRRGKKKKKDSSTVQRELCEEMGGLKRNFAELSARPGGRRCGGGRGGGSRALKRRFVGCEKRK